MFKPYGENDCKILAEDLQHMCHKTETFKILRGSNCKAQSIHQTLTLKVLVMTIGILFTAQWEEMGDVWSARYEPALRTPCRTIRVLSYSNCQRYNQSICK